MGILLGFAPWIVFWVLVGNVPAAAAVLVALAVAGTALVVAVIGRSPGRTLEIGAVVTFSVLTVLVFAVDQSVLERWLQPLGTVGLLLVALTSVLIGRPFVRAFAEVGQPAAVVNSAHFARVTTLLTWIWVAVLAGMTVSSAVPPIVQGDATFLDIGDPLSYICYWIVPFVLLALGALASRVLPDRMAAGADDIVRDTTFVAYSEATIDELYFLAQQHADREAGAGKEAHAVKVGGSGTPLVGDDSRQSWPSTYKVRERRR